MTLHKSIPFLLIPVFFTACFKSTHNNKYAVTEYATNFDTASNSINKEQKRFKHSYEEYNADSNLVYQEWYSTPNSITNTGAMLIEKTTFFYNGKQKLKAERELGKNKYIYTYEYTNGQLTKWLINGELVEEYKYNDKNEQIEIRVFNGSKVSGYYRSFYNDGLKRKTQYHFDNTIVNSDTFIYDKRKQLIEKLSYNREGEKSGQRLIIRNNKGQIIEEKWKDPYFGWRINKDGKMIHEEFDEANKYYYDTKGRMFKKEYYDIGNLITVYEFEYN
jgi:hypothetical protein